MEKLIPVSPGNDGDLLAEALSSYIFHCSISHKKTMDMFCPIVGIRLVVFMNTYIEEGLQKTLEAIQQETQKEIDWINKTKKGSK